MLDEIKEKLYIEIERSDTMTIQQKIKMALAYKGMSEAALAKAIGTSPSAFNQRMKTGKFTSSEMDAIAAALESEFVCYFRFRDGTEV